MSIDYSYIKDCAHVFTRASLIKGADCKSFTPLNSIYSRDENHAYYNNKVIRNAEPLSFQALGGEFGLYAKDETRVFYQGSPVNGADVESFTVLKRNEARDCHYIYDGKDRRE